MLEKFNLFEVECYFLLIIGQNKVLCKGGLYLLFVNRYIIQFVEGDYDYCQLLFFLVDKELVVIRNFDFFDLLVIFVQ